MNIDEIEPIGKVTFPDQSYFQNANDLNQYLAKQFQHTVTTIQQYNENDIKEADSENNQAVNLDEANKLVTKMNQQLEESKIETKFELYKKNNMIMIKLVDKKTKQVICEIPSSKVLNMLNKNWTTDQAGLMVDKKG